MVVMGIPRILNCSVQGCYWHLAKKRGLHFLPTRNETGRKKATVEQQQAYQWKTPSCPKPTAWREALEHRKRFDCIPFFTSSWLQAQLIQGVQKAKIPLLCGSPPNAQHLLEPQFTSLPSRGLQTAMYVPESTCTGTVSRLNSKSPDSIMHLRQLLLGWERNRGIFAQGRTDVSS